MIAGGVAPDVATLEIEKVPLFANMGAIRDLSSFIEEDADFDLNDYYLPIVEGMQYKGRQYGLPLTFSPVAVDAVVHPGILPEHDGIFLDSVEYAIASPYLFEDLSAWHKARSLFGLVDVGKMSIDECCKKFADIVNEALQKVDE